MESGASFESIQIEVSRYLNLGRAPNYHLQSLPVKGEQLCDSMFDVVIYGSFFCRGSEEIRLQRLPWFVGLLNASTMPRCSWACHVHGGPRCNSSCGQRLLGKGICSHKVGTDQVSSWKRRLCGGQGRIQGLVESSMGADFNLSRKHEYVPPAGCL